jgi:hypothetical protein
VARKDFNASDDYNPDDIYSGGSMDAHGHSSNLRCHVPRAWLGPLTMLVASPQWPEYDSVQAIIRDALYHRMHWASTQRDREATVGVARAMAIMRLQQKREEAERRMEEAEELDVSINDTVLKLLHAGDSKSANVLLDEFEDTVRTTQEEPHLTTLLETIERLRKRAWR